MGTRSARVLAARHARWLALISLLGGSWALPRSAQAQGAAVSEVSTSQQPAPALPALEPPARSVPGELSPELPASSPGSEALSALGTCRLVAVEPATDAAVLFVVVGGLVVVHAGEDLPSTCGPFRVSSVLADRLVVVPWRREELEVIREAWLPLAEPESGATTSSGATTGAGAAPRVLRRYPEEGLQMPVVLAPRVEVPPGGPETRRRVVEAPPP